MTLSTGDMFAVMLALSASILALTLAFRRIYVLERQVLENRRAYHNYRFATEAELMGKPYYWDGNSNSWSY